MKDTTRHVAESLFSPAAPEGSNAAKLQEIRARQIRRLREFSPVERQRRLERRRRGTEALFAPKERAHGNV